MIDYKEEYKFLQKASEEYEERLLKEIDGLRQENVNLNNLCDALEEEHNTTFKQWVKELQMFSKDRLKMNEFFNIFEDCVKKLNEVSEKYEKK